CSRALTQATSQDAELTPTQVLVPSTQMSDDVSLSQQYLAYAVAWPPTQPRDVGDKHDEDNAGDGGDCAIDRVTGEQRAAKDAQTKASDAHKNPVDPEVSNQEVQPKPAVRQSKDQVVLEMEGADEDAAGETEDSGDEAQTQVPGDKKKVESGNEKTGEMSMDGTGAEFKTKKRSEKTSNTPSATTRPKARSRGTRLEGKTADPNKSAGNLDNEETIKIVTKKGKKNEDGKANRVIGTEIEQ
ncbi:hypothetical protein HDZ31DRAFT_78669, partial [Schizophyllum fasciatum]